MKYRLFSVLIGVFLFTASATVGLAQSTSSGSLTGTVADPNGAVVANATVAVKNIATSQEFTVQTNGEGTFNVPALSAGAYTASITAPGFKTASVEGITIIVGTPSSIKVTLEVGAASETVTVSGAGGELLQTESQTVGTSISGRQITNLPYASRNALDLLLFLPGTSTAGRPRQSTVNGLPKSMLNITLDGLNIQDNLLKGSDGFFTSIQPKTDAVQEVTVSTATPGAESNAEGAVQIKFTTRSGGTEFHGSLYEEHRDKSLNSNFFWNNENLAPKPHFGKPASPDDKAPRTPILLNQFGGRVGGPIKIPYVFSGERKGFFFVNYEEYRLPEATLRSRGVLSPSAIAGKFTSGSTTTDLYALAAASDCDPNTAGLQPCPSTPDPLIASVLGLTRGATGTYTATSDPNIQTLTFTNSGGQKRQFPTVRLDFEVNKNNHIETIWNYQVFRSKVDFLNNADPFAPGFPNFGSQDSNRYSSSTAWRATIRPNLVNEARFGVQMSNTLFFPQNNAGQFANQGGFSLGIGRAASSATSGLAISAAADAIAPLTTINNPQRRNTPTMQFSDNLNYVRGKHVFNFGANVTQISTFLYNTTNGAVPAVGFGQDVSDPIEASMFNAVNFPSATARLQADQLYRVLTGRVTLINHAAGLNEEGTSYSLDGSVIRRYRQREFGIYAQDSWKLRPNLTLNYGLRYEVQYAPISRNKGLTTTTFPGLFGTSGSDFNALFKPGATGGTTTTFDRLPPGQHLYNTTHNLAPTVGFTYQPNFKQGWLKRLTGSSGQTVIRGGYAIAYDREGLNLTDQIFGGNFGGTTDLTQLAGSPTGFPRGTLLRSLPPPPGNLPAPVFPLIAKPEDNASAFAIKPNLKTPYVISFSGSIQRELTKDMVLEVGYVGNRGHQLLRLFNINEVNVLENGFAGEFKLAAGNLAANVAHGCGTTFRYFGAAPTGANAACTGTSPLPLFLAFFNGLPASQAGNAANYTSTRFALSTFTSRLTPSNLQAIGAAGVLAASGNTSANGPSYMANAIAAGLPQNFFVVNPTTFNNFGAGNSSFVVDNDGQTWFNALTFEVRRRMSKGVLADVNYSFSHASSNVFGSSAIANIQPATIRNTWLNKVDSPFDIRQSLKGSFIAELPVGRGRHFLGNSKGIVNTLLGDWTVNGTFRLSSGVPINIGNVQLVGMNKKDLQKSIHIRKTTVFNPTTGVTTGAVFWLPQDIIDNSRRAFNVCIPGTAGCDANGYATANLSGGPAGPIAGGSPSGRYFAPAGLNCLQSFTGQCGVAQLILHGPRFARADIGFEKKIKFTETKNLEFRFEFLNASNAINWRLGSFAVDNYTIGGGVSGTTPVPTFTSTQFGQLTGPETAYRDTSTTNDPGGRVGQIVVRFNF